MADISKDAYWVNEAPRRAEAKNLVIRWYPTVDKLIFSYPDYVGKYGDMKMGKSIVTHASEMMGNAGIMALLHEALGL